MFGWKRRGGGETEPSWQGAKVFTGLTEAELGSLSSWIERRELEPGDVLVSEGERAEDLLVLTAGQADVVRADPQGRQRVIGFVGAGEIVGEVALFDRLPRTATVRAVVPAEVWTLRFQALRDSSSAVHASAYHKLVVNMAGGLSTKFRVQTDESLATAQRREVMGSFLIHVLILLCGYVFLLSGLEHLAAWVPQNTMYVSVPLQIVFGLTSWAFIRQTGYPLRQFGIGVDQLLGSVVEAVLFTVPLLALLTVAKWLILMLTGTTGEPLFEHRDVGAQLADAAVQGLLVAYAVSSAVQELISRGALQSSLEMFIARPTARRDAIVISALLFSMMHLHMSFLFAVAAFLPGLFWGWLFARRRNLVGVTLSHVLVGGYVFFILGVRL